MLKSIMEMTEMHIDTFPKEVRKEYGQFFTSVSTAKYMASLISIDDNKKMVRILDAGAGNGMLSAAAIEYLSKKRIDEIQIDMYENDNNTIDLLSKTKEIINKYCVERNVSININIINRNFILDNEDIWRDKDFQGIYDIVIMNPPYKKINKCSAESSIMADIVYGQPNIYFLFMAMGCQLAKNEGNLIYITPRSWTSGLYFRKFREYLLNNVSIQKLHLYSSRNKVFDKESILQEIMITSAIKRKEQEKVVEIRTTESSSSYEQVSKMKIPVEQCISYSDNLNVIIPTNQEDVEALKFVSKYKQTPRNLGFQFKTGQVIEFRNTKYLKFKKGAKSIPLIHSCNIKDGKVDFKAKKEKPRYYNIDKNNETYKIKNRNMLLVKRFTSKEENRRLQLAVNIQSDNPDILFFATENHLNYMIKNNGEPSKCEIYGIYTILSSKKWDSYYRLISGNTQVNAEELNNMPMPDIETIQHIGRETIKCIHNKKTVDFDEIIGRVL